MDKSLDVKVGLDLLMAAKYMERIGDHAVNIAEWVEYSITGVHRNNEHQLEEIKVDKKIFKSSILASVIVLIIGMACVLGVLYRHFGGQIINELKKEAEYLSYGVELKGKDYLENVNGQDSRITYIDDAGNVLYDSMADEEAMENHKDREEFLEAEETGVGQAERISDTLSERTLYYAVRLSDNSVLRVSSTQDSVLALTVQLIPPALGILAVLIILACFLPPGSLPGSWNL